MYSPLQHNVCRIQTTNPCSQDYVLSLQHKRVPDTTTNPCTQDYVLSLQHNVCRIND
ncbi:hypothetical protein DPMN_174207 [Dreissena polymorpha]|uniref:Uncharacterized protein n=1 Tax=Dreissena polymorpha TaxID=45954 RepID=A0A9D4E6P3_DREPO|nr:hypothetical protein DPMN_174207 [Dreissena polymorpha]